MVILNEVKDLTRMVGATFRVRSFTSFRMTVLTRRDLHAGSHEAASVMGTSRLASISIKYGPFVLNARSSSACRDTSRIRKPPAI